MEGLRARGHANLLVCPPGSGAEREARRRGFAVECVAMRNDLSLGAAYRIAAVLRRHAPALVHCHTGRANWLGGLARALGARARALDAAHGPAREARPAHALAVPASAAARGRDLARGRAAAARGAASTPERIRVIWSAVDPAALQPSAPREALRAQLGAAPETPCLLVAANLVRAQGRRRAARGGRRARAASRCALWIAGDGPERAALEADAARLGDRRARALPRAPQRRARPARGVRRVRAALAPRGARRGGARGDGARPARGRVGGRRARRDRDPGTDGPAGSARRRRARSRPRSSGCSPIPRSRGASAPRARRAWRSTSSPSRWCPRTRRCTARSSPRAPRAREAQRDANAPRVGIIGARRVRQGLGPFVARDLVAAGAEVPCFVGDLARARSRPRSRRSSDTRSVSPRGYVDVDAHARRASALDAVAILSPAETHEEYLVARARRGLAVLCEKPLVWGTRRARRPRAAELVAALRRARSPALRELPVAVHAARVRAPASGRARAPPRALPHGAPARLARARRARRLAPPSALAAPGARARRRRPRSTRSRAEPRPRPRSRG